MSTPKARKAGFTVLLIAGLAAIPYLVSFTARADEQRAGVGNDAIVALGKMSKTLQAQHFSFEAQTFRAYAGPNGELLHIAHTYKALLSRPNRLVVDINGDDGASKLLYDGKNLVIYVAAVKKYASLPIPGDIDKALDEAQARTGVDFPLADLLANDSGESLLAGVTSGGPVGTATIDGVTCNHFFFVQAAEDLEWELWLEDNDRALPRRVVVTYRSLPGRPNFIAALSSWDFSTPAPDNAFTFEPPAGVTQVEFASKPGAPQGSQK
jgi:hypothetical protein